MVNDERIKDAVKLLHRIHVIVTGVDPGDTFWPATRDVLQAMEHLMTDEMRHAQEEQWKHVKAQMEMSAARAAVIERARGGSTQ